MVAIDTATAAGPVGREAGGADRLPDDQDQLAEGAV
jgi:hypothetical protein